MLNMLSYSYIDPSTSNEVTKGVKLLEYSYLLALLAIVLVALPLIAIFMFKNRKRQVNMALLAIILNVGFVAFHITFIKDHYLNTLKIPAQSTSYGIASFIPVAVIVFLAMAISNIRKDEKLVRSADRLR